MSINNTNTNINTNININNNNEYIKYYNHQLLDTIHPNPNNLNNPNNTNTNNLGRSRTKLPE